MDPEIAPRTEWACQPAAFIRSAMLAPFARRRSEMSVAILPVGRTPALGEMCAFFLAASAFGERFAREVGFGFVDLAALDDVRGTWVELAIWLSV